MWPLAVLCLALGIAGSVAQFQPAPVFSHGYTYVYQYETQIVNGIPTAAKQFSILKMKAQVMVTPVNSQLINVKFLKVGFWSLNGNPGYQYDPTFAMVDEMFLFRVVGPEIEQLEEDLQKPFTAPVGEPAEIHVQKDDPYWSVNIKRGLISLLTLQSPEDLEIFKLKLVSELSPVGLCNTSYVVTDKYTEPGLGGEWLKMMKIRDYQSCVRAPVWYKSFLNGKLCKNIPVKKDVVTPSFHVHYTLRKGQNMLDLTDAVGCGKVQVTPYSNQFEGAIVGINQTLSLIKKMTAVPLTDPKTPVPVDIFIFYPELVTDPIMTVSEAHFLDLDERLLDLAAQNTINIHTEEGWMRGKSFIDMLRTYDEASIEALADKYMKPDSPEKNITLAKTILNYLAIAGTWNTSRILLAKCDEYYLDQCPVVISLLGLTAQPRLELAQYLMQTSIPKSKKHSVKAIKVFLLGTLGGKMKEMIKIASESISQELSVLNKKLYETPSRLLRKKVKSMIASTKSLLSQYKTTTPHDDIVEYILNMSEMPWVDKCRALGNAGWDKLEFSDTDETKPYFPGDSFNRTQAILMLHKSAVEKPHQVIAWLTPVAKNTSEVSLVRNAAYWIIFKASPNRTMLEYIAQSIREEPNTHVAAFVTNFFYTIANSSCPCEQSLKKNVSTILHMLPKIDPNLEFSFFKRLQFFNDYAKMGGSLNFETISTNESAIPDAAAFVVHGNALGYDGNLFEMAYNSRYVQLFFDNLFGPKGNLTLRKSIFDIFARSARSASNPVEDIMEALKIATRTLPKPEMIGVVKMFDNVMNVFHMTDFIQDYLKNGVMPAIFDAKKWRNGINLDSVTNYGLGDIKLTVPIEAGFPVDTRLTAHLSFNVSGNVTFKVLPITDDYRTSAPEKFHFKLKAHPQGLVGVLGSVSADLGPIQLGVSSRMQAKVQAPIDIGLEVKLDGRKIYYFFLKPPINKDGTPFMQMETTPFTYTHILPQKAAAFHPTPLPVVEDTASEVLDIVDIDLPDLSTFRQSNKKFGSTGLGVSVEWSGQFAWKSNVRAPPFPFSGKNLLTIFLKEGVDVPRHFSVAVKCMAEPAHAAFSPANTSECDSFLSYWTGCLLNDNDLDDFDISPTPPSAGPFPDFVDLRKMPDISLEQIRKKLEQKSGVHLPFKGFKWGAIIVFNASSDAAPRGAQLELYWRAYNMSTTHNFQAHLYRTPLPNDAPKYEATLVTHTKYPIWKLSPEELLNATYQREVQKSLQEKFAEDPHTSMLVALNNTLYAMAAKHQHSPKLEPDYVMDSVMGDLLLMRGDKFSLKIRLLLQRLYPIHEQVLSFHDKSKDIMIVRKHHKLICGLVNRTLELQAELNELMPELPSLGPLNFMVAATLQYINLRDLEAVFFLMKIVDKTRIIPKVDEAIYTNIAKTYKSALAFSVKVINYILQKQPSTVECPFLKQQLNVLKTCVADVVANRTIDPSIIYTLVKKVDDAAEKLMANWKGHDMANEEHVLIGAQATIQHLLMKLLYKWAEDSLAPFKRKMVNPFLELRLQQQAGIGATVTALSYKQWSDLKILLPQLNNAEVALLKEFMHVREKIQGAQFFRIVYLISDLKNTTNDPFVLRDLYAEVKEVVKDMFNTTCLLEEEIAKLLDPRIPKVKVVLVYKLIKGLVSHKDHANFLRHIRTSFPQSDRKELYLDVERLLWETEILRGNLSLVFDKLVKTPRPTSPNVKMASPLYSITSRTVINLENKPPIIVEVEAVKSIEQVIWEYEQLDHILRHPNVFKHFMYTLGSHGNLSNWDSHPAKMINSYNHIHTMVNSDTSFVTPMWWKKPLMTAMNYVQFHLYNYSSFALPAFPEPGILVDSVLELSLDRDAYDLIIETMNFTRRYFNVPTSPKNPLYTPFRNTYNARWQITKMLTSNHLPARCSMANSSVLTFDKVVYQVPVNSSKRVVAAMDCSYLKSWAVISHMVNVTNGSKILEIYTDQPKLKVVIYPGLSVFVNNRPVHIIPSFKPFIVNSTVFYHKQVVSMKIAKYRGVLLLEFPLIGLNVFFDGNMFTLEGSVIMRQKLCGLCSSFDGFKAFEFEGPKHETFDSPLEMVNAYTVPNNVPNFSPPYVIGVIDQLDETPTDLSSTFTTTTTTAFPVPDQARYYNPWKKPSTSSSSSTTTTTTTFPPVVKNYKGKYPKHTTSSSSSSSTTTTTTTPPPLENPYYKNKNKIFPKHTTSSSSSSSTTTTTTTPPPVVKPDNCKKIPCHTTSSSSSSTTTTTTTTPPPLGKAYKCKNKFCTTTTTTTTTTTPPPLAKAYKCKSKYCHTTSSSSSSTTTTTTTPPPLQYNPYYYLNKYKKTTSSSSSSTSTTTTTTPPPLQNKPSNYKKRPHHTTTSSSSSTSTTTTTTTPPPLKYKPYYYNYKGKKTTSSSSSTTTTTTPPPLVRNPFKYKKTTSSSSSSTTTTTTTPPPLQNKPYYDNNNNYKKRPHHTTTSSSSSTSTTTTTTPPPLQNKPYNYFNKNWKTTSSSSSSSTTTTTTPPPLQNDPYSNYNKNKKTFPFPTTTSTTFSPLEGESFPKTSTTTTTSFPPLNACEPKPRTNVFKSSLRPGVICFSKVAIPDCAPKQCQVKSKGQKVKVPFTCLRENAQTEEWEQQLSSGAVDVIRDVKRLRTSRTRRIYSIPECKPKN